MTKRKHYRIYLHLHATVEWLKLPRQRRGKFFDEEILTRLRKYPELTFNWVDVEAFSGQVSDIAEITTADLQSYYFWIEELRDTPAFSAPYFEIVNVFVGFIDGFKEFESTTKEKK